jgi:hypothetical protein
VIRRATGLLVGSALLVSGCGHGATGGPSRAALLFAEAVADGNGAQACTLLAPATRAELESSAGKPCAEAVLGEDLPASTGVRSAEQYGSQSRVLLDRDVVFVSRFSLGWRVVAAGCEDRGPDHPYDCRIAGE